MEPMTPRKAATLPGSMRRRLMMMAAATLALATVATACSDVKTSSTATTAAATAAPTGKTIDYAILTGTLNGSGSSFQDTLEQKAKTLFAAKAAKVTVNYTKSGSSAGKTDLANQTKQFAGTDSLVKDADKPTFKGGGILYFPVAAAPITISFHVSDVTDLSFSPDTLAGIFGAKITSWDAPEIKADNPGATLPSKSIAVVHRSDGSGTTSNFTKYLKKASPSVWTLGAGDTVLWPTSTIGAEKNSGVASTISTTDGSIGYVDLADAVVAKLDMAKVKNKSGKLVAPTLVAASAALDGIDVKPDLTYDPLDAPGAAAYPITSPTWVIVYKQQPDAATAAALIGYLNFFLTDVQVAAPRVGYAALSASLQQKAVAQLDLITS